MLLNFIKIMIKVIQEDLWVELSYLRFKVIILNERYETFKENLFVEYGQGKRVKIGIEELTWGDFNLIFKKHIPKYNNPIQRRLDVEHLLSVTNWRTEVIDSYYYV